MNFYEIKEATDLYTAIRICKDQTPEHVWVSLTSDDWRKIYTDIPEDSPRRLQAADAILATCEASDLTRLALWLGPVGDRAYALVESGQNSFEDWLDFFWYSSSSPKNERIFIRLLQIAETYKDCQKLIAKLNRMTLRENRLERARKRQAEVAVKFSQVDDVYKDSGSAEVKDLCLKRLATLARTCTDWFRYVDLVGADSDAGQKALKEASDEVTTLAQLARIMLQTHDADVRKSAWRVFRASKGNLKQYLATLKYLPEGESEIRTYVLDAICVRAHGMNEWLQIYKREDPELNAIVQMRMLQQLKAYEDWKSAYEEMPYWAEDLKTLCMDQMARLAKSDDELLEVYRHSLRYREEMEDRLLCQPASLDRLLSLKHRLVGSERLDSMLDRELATLDTDALLQLLVSGKVRWQSIDGRLKTFEHWRIVCEVAKERYLSGWVTRAHENMLETARTFEEFKEVYEDDRAGFVIRQRALEGMRTFFTPEET